MNKKEIMKIHKKKIPIIIFGPSTYGNNNIPFNEYNFLINSVDDEKDINKLYSTLEIGFSE